MSTKQLSDLDFSGGARILNIPDATLAQQPATKAQLDAAVQGYSWKQPVRASSTANLTLSGTQTVDGVALIANDRILVKDQSTGSANGIYVVASGSWARATDADTAAEVRSLTCFVQEGAANGNSQYTCTTDDPITLGTTALVFVKTNQQSAYTAGTGITVTSFVVAVDTTVVARKVGANIGNGSATSFNVTHSLGTTDCVVEVRETGSTLQKVECDIVFTDTNTVTVTFVTAPTTGQYRVTVIG